jgi:glycosyltransferase involved in cell wall biosynthesis
VSHSPGRVAFDITPVISGRTGVARYVRQVESALRQQNAELEPFAIGRSSFPVPEGACHIQVPARLCQGWWRLSPWPTLERLVGPADLVHVTGLVLPRTRLPLVVTVHDLAALRHPELHPPRHARQQRTLVRYLRRAAVVLAVSAATAEEAVAFGTAPERVVVAPLGLTPLPLPANEPQTGAPQRPFLLTVGETAPRKGYPLLLEALTRVDADLDLVMVGPPSTDEERIQRLVRELGLGGRVIRLGPVGDAELAGLYRDALALCFPSISEGFGLPVLEAMASGTPVLSSDIAATRELAGSAALYVERRAADLWTQAIEAVSSDPAMRARLGEAGRTRAAQFTWERTASATLEAYRLALGSASVAARG